MKDLSKYEQPHESSNAIDVPAVGYASADEVVHHQSSGSRERKRGVPWTEEEHKLFLLGLQKVGKGDWRGILRNFVKTRTPTQVASHAQKYFLRRSNLNRRRRRTSLFDITTESIARASLDPQLSYIAKPAASWLDDFLVWLSPEAFGCCRKFTNGSFCPPDDQPPCCASNDNTCTSNGVCKDCTTCFRHPDLQNGRPSTAQFEEKLPWFLNALPSSDCAKGGHGAYTNSVQLEGYESGVIQASAFRTYHTPLNKQRDFVNSLRAARDFSSRLSNSLKIQIFPYSVFYMFFEQYLEIWRTALVSLAIAIGTSYFDVGCL